MKALQVVLGCSLVFWIFVCSPAGAEPWPSVQVARQTSAALGPLMLGMSQGEVQSKLGQPESASKRGSEMDSDGYTYAWFYASQGVSVYFTAPDESSPGSILAINVGPPCDWTALGGLKVGLNIEQASGIISSHQGGLATPIGSSGSEMMGIYYEASDTALIAKFEMGKVSGVYLGPNLP